MAKSNRFSGDINYSLVSSSGALTAFNREANPCAMLPEILRFLTSGLIAICLTSSCFFASTKSIKPSSSRSFANPNGSILIVPSSSKKTLKPFLLHTFFSILVFAFLTIAPLVWFDLRHNFINFNAFKAFFTDRQATVNFKVYKAIPGLWELITSIFTRLVAAKEILSGIWLTLFVLLFTVVYLIFQTIKKGKNFLTNNKGLVFILVWLLVGILGLGNYKQHIYDHYFGFLAPVPFLLTGWVLVKIWDWTKWSKVLSLVLIGFLVFLAVKQSPLANQPNRQLQRTEKVAQFVVEKSRGERFNLALIAERNYDDAYAYFLELWKKPLVRIDPQMADETITQQLFVICEQLPCQPVGHPKAEIAMFGWVKIEEQWQIEGVEVYKLIHNPDQK